MQHETFDRFAIALSSLCVIHCIALPIVASVTPLLMSTINHGNAVHEFWFHQFILIFIIPVSVLALVAGFRCHRKNLPLLLGSIGLSILVIVALFAEQLISLQLMSHTGETILTVIGGVIHAAGHITNALATKASHATSCSTAH
ncbi:MAG: MerC domain-containing protein [Gammaproteobacteria bacterium]|nr:MerC domain-containing protein [Gammaproteobacteria bacterium]MBT8125596.1 MerC domain-containing protein [Gammaproteobacteria bacterium]NNC68715.1 MerC domain-containing protein [Gammaproteobacteria bacterium]